MRNYEVYRLLEESLKAMLTSLPLVQVRVQQRSNAISSFCIVVSHLELCTCLHQLGEAPGQHSVWP